MGTQDNTSPAQMTSIGIGLAIAGLYGVLIGLEVLPVPGGRDNLHGPLWLATLIGGLVLLAAASCLIQAFGRANAQAELPADAPLWLRGAQYLIGVVMFGAFAVLGTWVAYASDPRYMSGGVPFLGAWNVWLARVMFGFGAVICWLATLGFAVQGARKLFRRDPTG